MIEVREILTTIDKRKKKYLICLNMGESNFLTVEEAIEEIKNGRMVIIVDDPGRENEGDFAISAEKVTPEAINFMAKYGRGLICLAIIGKRLDKLKISSMVERPDSPKEAAFAVSVDAKYGITTGISAYDRYITIKKLIDPSTKPDEIAKPGHVFPLRYKEGGVLVRAGHTEAIVDLCKLSGLYPAGVICEIMDEDGRMARLPKLIEFSKKFGIKIITIAEIIKYRKKTEKLIKKLLTLKFPTIYGNFTMKVYKDLISEKLHFALIKGNVKGKKDVVVRVHSSCFTGEVFGSLRCDCSQQLQTALKIIQKCKRGVLLYMDQEGRGIGLLNKLKAYKLQDEGYDTISANEKLGFKSDLRDYGIGAQILCDLGLSTIKLLTNNPRKIVALEGHGLKITKRIPIEIVPHSDRLRKYLLTKKTKFGHLINTV